jgi:hypothetical protein
VTSQSHHFTAVTAPDFVQNQHERARVLQAHEVHELYSDAGIDSSDRM